MAILAALAALSATALGPVVGRYRASAAAEAVAQAVALARVEARQQSRCYRIQILSAGAPVAPGLTGDTVRVARRQDADCEAVGAAVAQDTRFPDVRLPRNVSALVPAGFTDPEFRPNGYTRDGLDTEIQVGPTGAPTTRISIRSFGPVCSGTVNPVQACP
ncbi:MAG TPA: hypothetical protein VND93_30910 [Myxococcales bacterium]|nr:hypothetical protein [Myxococcales bacterium]